MSAESASVHALQAPAADRAVLAHPPLNDAARLLAHNGRCLEKNTTLIFGRSLGDLRREARAAVLEAARHYLVSAGEPAPAGSARSDVPLLVAGHQPELFHPGVWLKNFALHGLARRCSGVPLNLIVDNDTAKNAVVRLPAGERVVGVPCDHWKSETPFEERAVLDEAVFRAVPETASAYTRGWPFVPLLETFWSEARRQADRTPLLGERFAGARRAFERRWRCVNLEVPLSRVCATASFAWFAAHLLHELPRLHAAYNEAVHAYRQRYGLRGTRHPVPDLARDGAWLEAPLWAWRKGDERRGRLFVRREGERLELRSGTEDWPALRAASPAGMVEQLQELERRGCKVRTRALTTTLFARLFLGDVFLHGLGGAKYDEVTDDIVRRFYGLEPPRFLVLTGTLLLPFPRLPATAADIRRAQQVRRDCQWNPQRHLGGDGQAQELVRRKSEWIERYAATAPERRERFQRLREVTAQLQPFAAAEEQRWSAVLEQAQTAWRLNQVRLRRDFAFCLYPEEKLRPFCDQFLV